MDIENMTRIIEIADAVNEVQKTLQLLDGGVVEPGTPIAKLNKIYDLIQKNANEKLDFLMILRWICFIILLITESILVREEQVMC